MKLIIKKKKKVKIVEQVDRQFVRKFRIFTTRVMNEFAQANGLVFTSKLNARFNQRSVSIAKLEMYTKKGKVEEDKTKSALYGKGISIGDVVKVKFHPHSKKVYSVVGFTPRSKNVIIKDDNDKRYHIKPEGLTKI